MTDNPVHTDEPTELYEHYRLVADKGQEPLRIDKFLMNRIEHATRNKLQNAIRAGNVRVNDHQVKPNYRVKPDDLISILLPQPPRELEVIPEDIPLNIVYEDNDVILINKEAGMVVHPAYANYTGTLLNALVFHLGMDKSKAGESGLLVHRIDKDTTGLIIAAKNELSQSKLANQFYHHTIERKYVALVWGDVEHDEGTIEGHIGRSPKDRRVMIVFPGGDRGKEAITHYKVLQRFGYVTLLECRLETGRTHQIRAHMTYFRHPLFNDETYGGHEILKGTTFTRYKQFIRNCFKLIPRQALHAKSLGFTHPTTGKYMLFDSELPEDLHAVIEKWESYVKFSKEEFE